MVNPLTWKKVFVFIRNGAQLIYLPAKMVATSNLYIYHQQHICNWYCLNFQRISFRFFSARTIMMGMYYPDSKVHGASMGPTWGRQETPGAPWDPDRRRWLFSAVRGGIWTPHSPVLIKISADKRPLNQLTVKNLFFSLFIKTFCH